VVKKTIEFFRELLHLLAVLLLVTAFNYALGFFIMLTRGGRPAHKSEFVIPYSSYAMPLIAGCCCRG
jgi:hypothetical protein